MVKLTTKEDIALLVEEASEMFEETGCVPDVDGQKVRAEKIVPRAGSLPVRKTIGIVLVAALAASAPRT